MHFLFSHAGLLHLLTRKCIERVCTVSYVMMMYDDAHEVSYVMMMHGYVIAM